MSENVPAADVEEGDVIEWVGRPCPVLRVRSHGDSCVILTLYSWLGNEVHCFYGVSELVVRHINGDRDA